MALSCFRGDIMLSDNQKKNYAYFNAHLAEWLNDPLKRNKFSVILDEEIKGIFDSFETAFQFACTNYPSGEFIIQQIIDQEEIVEFLRVAV